MKRNNGSALLGSFCLLLFKENSTVTFHLNSGYSGGAMHLLDHSAILVSSNSSFVFSNNTAETKGGAIYYHSSEIIETDYLHDCFITREENAEKSSIAFLFLGNKAGVGNKESIYGSSIYSTSLLSCLHGYEETCPHINESFLSSFANFTFTDNNRRALTTEVGRFSTCLLYTSPSPRDS